MQGFIISVNRVKDEDLIVTIISKDSLETLYRFYGARHGSINIGFKIDYETESSAKSSISRLKDVLHVGFKWIHDRHRLRIWQDFIKLFHPHLKGSEELEPFYFELLDIASRRWESQNPKRVAIESYVQLLEYEGRLHKELICFFCEKPIIDDISLIRAFLPTHHECSHTLSVTKSSLNELFNNYSTIFFSDKEIDRLWHVLNEGL